MAGLLKEEVRPRPVPANPRRVALREAALSDFGQVIALQVRNGLTPRPYSEWSSLWTENPAYRECRLPIGWVLEDPNGKIVGYLGNLPLRYRFQGNALLAATHHSWVVDPQYRLNSVELLSRFLKQPEIDLFIGATPNPAAEAVLRALDFTPAPSGQWNQAGFWITGYRGFASGALRASGVPWARALAVPLSAGLLGADLFRRILLRAGPRPHHGEFEVCAGFDSRFDTFWEEMKAESPGRLLAERSRETLDWHFRPALARESAWILASARGRRLVAYAIFDRQDHHDLGLQRLRITDFQALRGFEQLLSPALRWALDACRRKIHMLENLGCWMDRLNVIGTSPWYHRRLKCWQFYYKARSAELSRQLRNPAAWAPSAFDGDASL